MADVYSAFGVGAAGLGRFGDRAVVFVVEGWVLAGVVGVLAEVVGVLVHGVEVGDREGYAKAGGGEEVSGGGVFVDGKGGLTIRRRICGSGRLLLGLGCRRATEL